MAGTVHRADTRQAATSLAEYLLSPGRSRPVVVVTQAAGTSRPYIDAEEIAAAVGDLAEVYLVPTGPVSWGFSDAMPPMTQVYGGAGRVYATDLGWASNPYRSKLRFAYGAKDGPRATEQLISDALSLAATLPRAARPAASSRPVRVTVDGVIPPSRVLVRHDSGQATIWQELTFPGVPVERAFAKRMVLDGVLDVAQRRVDVTGARIAADDACRGYQVGDVVLGRVASLTPTQAAVEVFPGLEVPVGVDAVTGNPMDSLTDLMSAGEVVLARVVHDGSGEAGWRLSLLDVEDDDVPAPAPSLLPGGPPWLLPPAPRAAPVLEPPTPEEAAPAPVQPAVPAEAEPVGPQARRTALATAQLSLQQARQEVEALRPLVAQLDTVQAERDALAAERDWLSGQLKARDQDVAGRDRTIEQLRTDKRHAVAGKQRAEKRARNQQGRDRADDSHAFLDPTDQLRHEIYLAWVRRIPASDKATRPLGAYVVGPAFLPSLGSVEGVDRAKVVDVVVEVVTGLVDEVNGRDLHLLRRSEGGGTAAVTRPDGATCWRAALQVNTPSARRLHFWRGAAGIELSRVVLHDDMEP